MVLAKFWWVVYNLGDSRDFVAFYLFRGEVRAVIVFRGVVRAVYPRAKGERKPIWAENDDVAFVELRFLNLRSGRFGRHLFHLFKCAVRP